MTNRHAHDNNALTSESAVSSRLEDVESFERAEDLLQSRLAKTRREIRRVDLFTACFTCATLTLAILFLGVLCDGWIFSEGLSVRGRVFFVLLLLVVSTSSFLWKVAPILRRRVNALYAAKILEETQQDKHNLTINWLQLCHGANQESHANDDYRAEFNHSATDSQREALKIVALQAARISKRTPDETAADCSSLIRWGIALASLASLCAIYAILSPKNPFVSAKRIVAPTASVERPQALRFDSVEPGDAVVFQGDFLEIEATISGAKTSEKVEVLWETEDGRVSDVAVPMEPTGPSHFKATLPDAPEGFTENINYRVVAGRGSRFESSSEVYHATVRPQPSFRVEKSTLKFPAYTGLPPQTFENQGDVRAIENTTVEIVARATEKLDRAYLLPDGDQTRAIKMAIRPDEPEIATASFTLQWSDDERRSPLFSSYTLLSEDVGGEKNRDAQVYDVSILADLPPTVRWESENAAVAQVPLNDVLRVAFVAEDPDYSIRRAELHVAYGVLQQGDQADQKPNPKPIELPLSASLSKIDAQGATPYVGPQTLRYALVPEKLGLSVGDELEYWGVVFDSKTPEANVGVSEKRVFIVVDPVDSPSDPNEDVEEPAQNENSGDAQGAESSTNQNGGSEGSDSSPENDGQNEGDGEKGSNADQQDGASQEGQDAESSPANDQGESGERTDENASQGNDAQNQNGTTTDSGTESESTQADNQSGGGNQNADSGETESNGGDSSDPSDDSSPNGNSSPGGSSTSPQNGDAAEPDKMGTSGASDDVSEDNQTDAPSLDEAFQKILDYMNANQNRPNENGSDSEAGGTGTSEGTKNPERLGEPSNETDGDHNSQNEVDPNFEPSSDPRSPQGKRSLPTRTSPDKPSDDAPSFQAENPEKIDPNSQRRQGDVDPNTNDFLAQNADPNRQESASSPQKNRNSNITLDPLDQNPSTSADAVNPDAPEAKGDARNVAEGGATEVDNDGKNATGQSSASNSNNNRPENGSSPTSNADGQSDGDDRLGFPNGQGDGSDSLGTRNPSEKKGETPFHGGSDDLGVAHGGGGAGSGLGEIEQGEERLAPADAPRLQYAEKATSLVLEYLEDSLKGKVDKRLLDELNWTEEEARAFLDRWKKMRDAALQDADARDQYLEALKNVSLDERASLDDSTPVDSTWMRDPDEVPKRSGSREASRFKTPDRLSERVKAFTRGVSSSSGAR